MNAPQPTDAREYAFSARYLALVGGLMALIIAMLAVLWMRERSRRVAAEGNASSLAAQNQHMSAALGQLFMARLSPETAPAAAPFQRQDHQPVKVVLDGRETLAYVLPAEGGKRFGFQPGDVILVASQPATATSGP